MIRAPERDAPAAHVRRQARGGGELVGRRRDCVVCVGAVKLGLRMELNAMRVVLLQIVQLLMVLLLLRSLSNVTVLLSAPCQSRVGPEADAGSDEC